MLTKMIDLVSELLILFNHYINCEFKMCFVSVLHPNITHKKNLFLFERIDRFSFVCLHRLHKMKMSTKEFYRKMRERERKSTKKSVNLSSV